MTNSYSILRAVVRFIIWLLVKLGIIEVIDEEEYDGEADYDDVAAYKVVAGAAQFCALLIFAILLNLLMITLLLGVS